MNDLKIVVETHWRRLGLVGSLVQPVRKRHGCHMASLDWCAGRTMNRREALESAVRILAPGIPRHEFESVVDHALVSPGLHNALPETAAWLSLVSFIRHRLTDYDTLLDDGYDAESARFFVLDDLNAILTEWRSPRRVDGEEPEA